MLETQRFLRAGGCLDDLNKEFSIQVYSHPSRPLVGLKYHMIDSPKSHAIPRECRGLVLERDTWRVMAKGFPRFFNIDEMQDEHRHFDWSSCTVSSKEDGSLILLYRHEGEILVNTSGSFALTRAFSFEGTFSDLFWESCGVSKDAFHEVFDSVEGRLTLVFELCTSRNKIIRRYPEPSCFLLAGFSVSDDESITELSDERCDALASRLSMPRPVFFQARDRAEVARRLRDEEDKDSTFEGYVLKDASGLRMKWKTPSYVSLHGLRGQGDVLSPKNLVPLCLGSEKDEVLATLPELRSAALIVDHTLKSALHGLTAHWYRARTLKDQKAFALKVKDHPLSGLLFTLRREKGEAGEAEDLRQLFRAQPELLARKLFSGQVFDYDFDHHNKV